MELDVKQIRDLTPGTKTVNHLLAAGSALMPEPVITTIKDHLDLEAQIGGYEAHAQRFEPLEAVYDDVAALIGAKPQEIALVEHATAAWTQAFYALPLKAGDRVLTCQSEYGANYVAYLQRKKRDGIIIDVIPNDEAGAVDVSALEQMIDERVALIAITWIPTGNGLVNPAAEIGKVARKHDIPFLLDACQAVGQMPVDVTELNCDFLSATGRKFLRGPRGTGFLYVREELIRTLEPAIIDHFAAEWVAPDRYELRPDARRFEKWENAYALRAGLGAAVRYAQKLGIKAIQQRAWGLAASLRDQLATIPGITLQDTGSEKCAIVTFSMAGQDPYEVKKQLAEQNIAIGASSPDGTLLDATARNLGTVLRASPHYYNTNEEIDQLVAALKAL